ncbi:MAG: S1C family serine protease [Planctomycetaceae bacterium]|jgi:serine protease Do|nr:S1C family serine protease [Planctomycetaceae bacterium]
MTIKHFIFAFVFASLTTSAVLSAESSADVIRAVDSVRPHLVRIDTIGGHERVEGTLANEGTTTGLLYDNKGRIITSAFNFLHEPSAILIRFPDGTRKVARKVATDRNRMLTLLQVDITNDEAVKIVPTRPLTSLQIGESVIALGCSFSETEPNVAVGVLSGTGRIWGKAIQTDAAVSPSNYGGPLVDTQGKVIGILAPLSMTAGGVTAGHEFYDAGIGMAIPMDDVANIVLPKLQAGKDVESGEVGIVFPDNAIFVGEPLITDIMPDSPAAKSGLKKGDRITKLNDKPITTALSVVIAIKQSYVGDTIQVTYSRDGKEQTTTVTTAAPSEIKRPD